MSTSEFGLGISFYSSGASEYRSLDGSIKKLPAEANEIKTVLNESYVLYPSSSDPLQLLKCQLVAKYCAVKLDVKSESAPFGFLQTVLVDKSLADKTIIGTNAVCKYIFLKAFDGSSSLAEHWNDAVNQLIDIEETLLVPALANKATGANETIANLLSQFESQSKAIAASSLTSYILVPVLAKALSIVSGLSNSYPTLRQIIQSVEKSEIWATAQSMSSNPTSKSANRVEVLTPPTLDVDWSSIGMFSALRQIFALAIRTAFPEVIGTTEEVAVMSKCGNPTMGHYQCNNALGISKMLKSVASYTGPKTPKDVAEQIIRCCPHNEFVESLVAAPNGFINIKISPKAIVHMLSNVVTAGVKPPKMDPLKILVDFSSPNIAKEMHVGHLRSTIIGDAVCRILEFCGHEVARTNHVGDWGTQFGMLITYLQQEYPDILENPPNISDLTAIYKQSKKRFDENELFKETSRLNVVKLQSGDHACRKIWTLLCDISRLEFQNVYDILNVTLKEVGESFYNPIIPTVIAELESKGLIENEDGMLIISQEKYDIPLILRKSDGGYGYDSTDMAALSYRLRDLKRDWIIIITDAGQANHFYMCFDAGKKMGWVNHQRLDHIGFGVVCGDDGKRFKTRSSETVRLIDLLNASKDKMYQSIQERVEAGKSSLAPEEIAAAAAIIGYGAIKYFDLSQHPASNYIFSYERMLETKGDTAVYLLFAYARLASILRKAEEEKGLSLADLMSKSSNILQLEHASEKALGLELSKFPDVISGVLTDLLPNRLCNFLYDICVKFTDFVTQCHVLNAQETNSRVILCEATRRVMAKCFDLLGIGTLERI